MTARGKEIKIFSQIAHKIIPIWERKTKEIYALRTYLTALSIAEELAKHVTHVDKIFTVSCLRLAHAVSCDSKLSHYDKFVDSIWSDSYKDMYKHVYSMYTVIFVTKVHLPFRTEMRFCKVPQYDRWSSDVNLKRFMLSKKFLTANVLERAQLLCTLLGLCKTEA